MHNIEQLRTIRDEALGRLQANTDYKLLTSLDSLIVELEGITAIAEMTEKSILKITPENTEKFASKAIKTTENNNEPEKASSSETKGNNDTFLDLSREINGGISLS